MVEWYKMKVYVLVALHEESENRSEEFTEHYAETFEKAEELRESLLKMRQYKDVHIKPKPEEREFWKCKEA